MAAFCFQAAFCRPKTKTAHTIANTMKNRVKKIHFVGIGGSGMCGIAEVLHNLNFRVSGSDQSPSAVTERLQQAGIRVFHGHRAEQVEDVDVVVTSTAVQADNPEVQAAHAQHIPVIPRALMLAELMRLREGIAIAGTHGKTTTTSLTASILSAAGLDPTFVIGGKLTAAGSNAKLGQGDYIVAEADESDASFLYLSPVLTVVTNIDEDHMDTYGHDARRLHQAFIDFVHRIPFYGKAFLCSDSANVRAILPEIRRPYSTYAIGDENADLRAYDIEAAGAQMRFKVAYRGKTGNLNFDVRLNLPGRHNVLNALASIGIALECGVPVSAIQDSLRHFAGVNRRFQHYGEIPLPNGGSALIIDDYGHHPAEMSATLAAARGAYPDRRLVLAFQPHRYSRTRDLFDSFVSILASADALALTEVYAAGEAPIEGADSRALARALQDSGAGEPLYCENIAALPHALLGFLQDGDVLLAMGAGSISKTAQALVDLTAKTT